MAKNWLGSFWIIFQKMKPDVLIEMTFTEKYFSTPDFVIGDHIDVIFRSNANFGDEQQQHSQPDNTF